MIVRGHFDHDQARAWDDALAAYLQRNRFVEHYRGAGDEFFGDEKKAPQIFPIYWSRPQMEARQSHRMAIVQRLLNSLWHDSSAAASFDATRSVIYPDRVRRRPAGTTSSGLAPHVDAGTLDLWMKAEYQQAFRHVFDGSIESFDPWDANGRTDGDQFDGSTMTSVFRTFQGWTALSDMAADQGVLESIPIPGAIAYLLLRPLLDDVESHDMCGVSIGRSFWVTDEYHGLLREGLSRIPGVRAGDSAWWHGDLVHGVAPVTDQQGWGNVMYIPAAPWCARNERYAARLGPAIRTGQSPSDFPDENYEVGWIDRFTADDLNDFGRQSMGL
ncbi:MAG: YbiU family protein [Actinomycetota bacterium]